jgi:hypothetical protein
VMKILKVKASTIILYLLLFFLIMGVTANSMQKIKENNLEETITETVYIYTGIPVTETSTRTIREYVTVTQTITEFSTILRTQSITIVKTISSTITEIITITIHEYLPFETYTIMLALTAATFTILLIILIRLRRSETKQVR